MKFLMFQGTLINIEEIQCVDTSLNFSSTYVYIKGRQNPIMFSNDVVRALYSEIKRKLAEK